MMSVVISPLSLSEFCKTNALDGSSGKTCRVSSVRLTVPTSLPYSVDGQDLILNHKSLPPAELSQGISTQSLGGCLTVNISECPNVVVESLLSDILDTTGDHLQRYCLTAKACEGILRRAKARGKELPPLLKMLLEQVAQSTANQTESAVQ